MSFIAIEPATPRNQHPAEPVEAVIIKNDGWFPDINLLAIRAAMRLDGTVTDDRLTPAIVAAIQHVNCELLPWKLSKRLSGHASLADIPADKINEESTLIASYRRAVYSTAKADLIEHYRDYDATGEGNKKADRLESSIDEQRRNAHWAIANILCRPHLTVELI